LVGLSATGLLLSAWIRNKPLFVFEKRETKPVTQCVCLNRTLSGWRALLVHDGEYLPCTELCTRKARLFSAAPDQVRLTPFFSASNGGHWRCCAGRACEPGLCLQPVPLKLPHCPWFLLRGTELYTSASVFYYQFLDSVSVDLISF